MPVQIGGVAVGAAVGTVVSTAITSVGGWALRDVYASIDVDKAEAQYAANYVKSVHYPSSGSMIELYTKGGINSDSLWHGLRQHGIKWQEKVDPKRDLFREAMWNRVVEYSFAVPSISDAYRGLITNRIDNIGWQDLMIRNGAKPEAWHQVASTLYATPSAFELIEARRRGIIDSERFKEGLDRLAIREEEWRDLYSRFTEYLPPPSDLVQFAVKDVFDPVASSQGGLFKEFPEGLRVWFRRQGMDYPLGVEGPDLGGGLHGTWSDVYWGAHWRHLSPEQIYRFHHLFRPGRIERYRGRGWDVRVWTTADVRTALKVADYPPGFRDFLAASEYSPIRLVDIRNGVRFAVREGREVGVGSRTWAIDQLLDRALHPDDAADTYEIWKRQAEEQLRSSITRLERGLSAQLVREVAASFVEGILDRDQAEGRLAAVGLDGNSIVVILDLVESKQARVELRAAVRAVKADFLRGGIANQDLRPSLLRLGLSERRVASLESLWKLEKRIPHREQTSAQILKHFREGLITLTEARDRLSHLGWSKADSLLFLDDASRQIAQRQATLFAAAERTRSRQEKEAMNAIRRAEAQLRQLQSHLRTLTPVSTLKKWIKKGLVDRDWFFRRMGMAGYSRDLAERYLAETERNGPPPPPENGGEDEGEKGENP